MTVNFFWLPPRLFPTDFRLMFVCPSLTACPTQRILRYCTAQHVRLVVLGNGVLGGILVGEGDPLDNLGFPVDYLRFPCLCPSSPPPPSLPKPFLSTSHLKPQLPRNKTTSTPLKKNTIPDNNKDQNKENNNRPSKGEE